MFVIDDTWCLEKYNFMHELVDFPRQYNGDMKATFP